MSNLLTNTYPKIQPLSIDVQEEQNVQEGLVKYKMWFNGLKKFTSVWIIFPKAK